MSIEELLEQTVDVPIACGNAGCPSAERDEVASVCRFFDLVCGDCSTLIRQGDLVEAN